MTVTLATELVVAVTTPTSWLAWLVSALVALAILVTWGMFPRRTRVQLAR